jgi:cytochrome c oxidase subunit III
MTPADRRPAERLVIDVSAIPETTFGHRGIIWWATVAFMAIEGTTLAICATAYLYVRVNAAEWPPRPASAPELLVPTINLIVILSTMPLMARAKAAAMRFDVAGVRRWMAIDAAVTLVAVVLRWFEFQSLNVRWDTNAYGSALWAIVFAHTTLLVTDLLESSAIGAIFFTDRIEPKHFSDVEDAALYQYFLALSWLVLYVVAILGPRVL